MFPNCFLAIIFAVFLGGCGLFGAGCVLTRLRAERTGHTLRIIGTIAWCIAVVMLLVGLFFQMCGYPVI